MAKVYIVSEVTDSYYRILYTTHNKKEAQKYMKKYNKEFQEAVIIEECEDGEIYFNLPDQEIPNG